MTDPGSAITSAAIEATEMQADSQGPGAPERWSELGSSAKPSGLTRDALRRLRQNPGAVAGLIVLLAIIVISVFAGQLAPYDPIQQDTQAIRQAPSREHLMGTDNFGRDIFSRVLYGGRRSLPVGFVAIGIASVIGVTFGLIAGYLWGFTDTLVMRGSDILLAFPGILLALALVAILGTSLFNLMLAVGIATIPEYTRVVRSAVLTTRETEYVTAARVSGAGDGTIMFRHILPNVLPPIIVLVTLGIAGAIILGSTLSFLGLGVKPPVPEWGNMLSDGRTMMRHQWWVAFFPGLAIMLTVLAINLFGDGLRDAIDPRMRNR
jgi:peptide/nickel transport system permease protein